ncbi:WYL domain-containing protein [Amycolatopsis balhimycina]|uniref:WYL domain-containing protein n=1 Tax=Amycolatopsis balhimycina TaxID=208443 RepID=UPI001FE1C215|nr:WYL domain-containing protein [Amycolatopsis balhimycina]
MRGLVVAVGRGPGGAGQPVQHHVGEQQVPVHGVLRYQARFTLHVSAETAAERIAPATGALEPIDERSCTLRTGSDSLDELAIYVAGKGFDFEVHEPPELVEHVRVLAARFGRAAG